MKTRLSITIINKKTKERNQLYKFYDGLLLFPVGCRVETGIYMSQVDATSFDVRENLYKIYLDDETELDDKVLPRIEILKSLGWQ